MSLVMLRLLRPRARRSTGRDQHDLPDSLTGRWGVRVTELVHRDHLEIVVDPSVVRLLWAAAGVLTLTLGAAWSVGIATGHVHTGWAVPGVLCAAGALALAAALAWMHHERGFLSMKHEESIRWRTRGASGEIPWVEVMRAEVAAVDDALGRPAMEVRAITHTCARTVVLRVDYDEERRAVRDAHVEAIAREVAALCAKRGWWTI